MGAQFSKLRWGDFVTFTKLANGSLQFLNLALVDVEFLAIGLFSSDREPTLSILKSLDVLKIPTRKLVASYKHHAIITDITTLATKKFEPYDELEIVLEKVSVAEKHGGGAKESWKRVTVKHNPRGAYNPDQQPLEYFNTWPTVDEESFVWRRSERTVWV
jgi:hypothetical protein